MKAAIRIPLLTAGVLGLCLPAAFFVTILLFPFWSWLESEYGIEAAGHSGPAEWRYWATYALLCAALVSAYRLTRRLGKGRR